MAKKTPATIVSKIQTKGNWAAASFQGTLYETQSAVIDYLATLKHADTARRSLWIRSRGSFTFVIFQQ